VRHTCVVRCIVSRLAVAGLIYGFGLTSTLLVSSVVASASAPACDYYASPTGSGSNSGLTPLRPFRPQDFWALARPGKTLCLLDGTYRGAPFMLAPPTQGEPTLVGTSAKPITIRALNDGQVRIDGQGVRRPVLIGAASWVLLEGFDACCSSENVVSIFDSHDVTLRRIVAWDAKDVPDISDYMVLTASYSPRVTFEDVAGFGRGRKIFQFIANTTNGSICRRCWGRWEGYESIRSKPRIGFQSSYRAPNTLAENVLMTWSAEQVSANLGAPDTVLFVSNEAAGLLRVLGSVAYVKGNAASFHPADLVENHIADGNILLQDMIVVIEPGFFPSKIGFSLRNVRNPPALTATRLSFWGGSGTNRIGNQWEQTNVCASRKFPGQCPNPYTGANGANVCKRYVNGTLTNDVLWPWPMDQRIKAALAAAGRNVLAGSAGTVTSEIESLLGAIPAACRSDGPGR
jgi:hypothetical protein